MEATSAVKQAHGTDLCCWLLEFNHDAPKTFIDVHLLSTVKPCPHFLISGTFAKGFICFFELMERNIASNSFEIYTHWLRQRYVGLCSVWTQKRWKISCYFQVRRYDIFMRKPTCYFTGVCVIYIVQFWIACERAHLLVRVKERKEEDKPTRTALTLEWVHPHTDWPIIWHGYSAVICFCDPVRVHVVHLLIFDNPLLFSSAGFLGSATGDCKRCG